MARAGLAFFLFLSACGRTQLGQVTDGSTDAPMPDAGVCSSDRDCDDGSFCNGSETCVAGACVDGTPVLCDDGVGCTADRCDETGRTCESVPDGTRCEEGSICDPERGCVRVPCSTDEECVDTFACNGTEACRDGFCAPGSPVLCMDRVDCTRDECSESAGGCTFSPDHAACADSTFCNGRERCNPRLGCVPGAPPSCDDSDECTDDSCDEATDSCIFVRRGDPMCVMPTCPNQNLGTRLGAVARGSTTTETDDLGGSCGGSEAPERTFAWRAPSAGTYVFDTLGSTYDTLLYVMRSCSGPELACNDDAAGLTSQIVLTMSAAERVVIVVDGFGRGSGDYVLNISRGDVPTETFCGDRIDDDGDGLVDCDDPDCFADVLCITPCAARELSCRDGRDEDCDMFFDCDDPDCTFTDECRMPCAPFEFDCRDMRDEDCDRAVDCADVDCGMDPFCLMCMPTEPFELSCRNGLDDDCNGLFDCDDPFCMGVAGCPACTPTARVERRCTDGLDDDCNGSIDCADPACIARPECAMCVPVAMIEIDCGDVRDDDCNGLLDCADPACAMSPICSFDAGPRPDAGMCMATATREIGPVVCTDGSDNDCDRRADCADPDCSPFGPTAECCDDIDNDGDGQVDLFTCRCLSDADCVGVGTLEQVCWTSLFSICAPRCNFYGGDAFCSMVGPGLSCDATSGQCR